MGIWKLREERRSAITGVLRKMDMKTCEKKLATDGLQERNSATKSRHIFIRDEISEGKPKLEDDTKG
jgi:hypothetical protein